MTRQYHQMPELVPVRGFWCLTVHQEPAALIARHADLRAAVARVFYDPVARRGHLVLWIGVDPRWVVERVRGIMKQQNRTAIPEPTARPATWGSSRRMPEPVAKTSPRPPARTTPIRDKANQPGSRARGSNRIGDRIGARLGR